MNDNHNHNHNHDHYDNRNDNDNDLRTVLLATGDRPTDEFRNQLHDTLISAAGGRDTVQIAPRSAIAHRRPAWPILAAAAAVAALVAGIAVVGRNGSDPLVPSTDPVSTEPREASADVTATDLIDRPWVSDQRDDVTIPTIRFTTSALVYTDACGAYSGTWNPKAMTIGEIRATSTFDDCEPTGTAGDLVGATISVGDGVIALSADDEVIATFTDAAALGSAGETDLIGSWELDGHVIRFEPGTMYLENCSDTWSITDHLVTYRTLAKDECFSGFTTRHGGVLNRMLGSDDLSAIRSGSDLLLVDRDTTLRLTSTAVGDPGPHEGTGDDDRTAVEALAGTRWIVDTVDGPRYEWSLLPYVEFQASSQPMIAGFNGCIDYTATGTIEETDDRQTLRIDGREGRLLRCAVDRTVEPTSGQIVASPNPGVRMTWTTVTGNVTEFVALDSLPLIGADRLPGRWTVSGDSTSFIDITPDDGSGLGTLSIGSCAVSFELGARLTTGGWPDPGSCLDDPEDADTVRLIEALAAGVEARWEPLSQALVLANDRFVFRLGAGSTPLDPTRIEFAAGSAYGFRPGDVVSSDDVLGEVSAVLGAPTHDTGWFVTAPTGNAGDCLGRNTTRTIWWDDLSMSFWRRDLGNGITDEVLWTWTVGDTRASRLEDRREPYLPPADARSGLTTGADIPISVGSTEEELEAAYGSRLPRSPVNPLDDGTTSWSSAGDAGWELHGVSAIVLTRDGLVIGFGSAIVFC